jgi:hypothetical protein
MRNFYFKLKINPEKMGDAGATRSIQGMRPLMINKLIFFFFLPKRKKKMQSSIVPLDFPLLLLLQGVAEYP